MGTIRTVTEAFIRLVKREIHEGAVLALADDVFEVKRTPSVLLQGPTLSENGARRSQTRFIERDRAALTFESCRAPRLYHLDFDLVVTTDTEGELLDLTEKVARFYQTHPVLEIGAEGALNLTERLPLGGLKRVNLSNLRQASGRARIEDCPVYDGEVQRGKLVRDLVLDLQAH
ncbi:MAG TPA: hypothetical protein PLA90_09495 [Candidatus Sumerlaeota bacterium]|nr:hypothetical protein [Candidatus Sumerlaeota bacterium]